MKTRLTDRGLKALKPRSTPYDVMDDQASAFGVKVMPTGEIVFIMYRRFPGSAKPTRRKIGRYPEMSLAEARNIAHDWTAQIRKGIDPSREEAAAREAQIEAERARKMNTVESVLESYLLDKTGLRSIRKMETDMKRILAPWTGRSVQDIRAQDVKDLIGAIKARGMKGQALVAYATVKGFFNWIVKTGNYGLDVSPCAKIDTFTLVGSAKEGSRTLAADYELRAYWRASERLPYPTGPFFQLLMLTALRRSEVSDARWSEIDLAAKLWTIPGERMKNGAAHVVPITPEIAAVLARLPRFEGGDYVFSSTKGAKPISAFSKAKNALDAAMRADLEAQGYAFADFVIHDIRRTCRTRFSGLRIDSEVREMLLAHTRPTLHRIYDLHRYDAEKRAALESWHRALRNIIEPATGDDNVVPLRA